MSTDDQQHDGQHHRQDRPVDGKLAQIYVRATGRSGRGGVRADLRSDARALQALDNDAVFRFQAFANDAKTVIQRTQRDGPGFDGVIVLDDEHDLARLIGCDRAVRQQQRLIGRTSDQRAPGRTDRAKLKSPCSG